jgi:hypothetical protein
MPLRSCPPCPLFFDSCLKALLRIVKQGVVASDFVQSKEQLDEAGLRVYVPDNVPETVPRPLSAADVYEPAYVPEELPTLSASDDPVAGPP